MSYLVSGNNPAAIKTAERNIFTATANQTTFTISQGYQVGDIDVFLNGVRLVDSDDYYATNGTTVVLTSGAIVGDSLVVICYRPYQVTDFYSKSEQDTRYVNTSGDTMSGELVAPFLTLDRRSWTAGLKVGTTSKDYAIYREWANNTNTISIGNVTDGVEHMRFDTLGRISTPNQPSFSTYCGANATGPGVVPFGAGGTAIKHNRAGWFNQTTYAFTAQVAGSYIFSCYGNVNGATSGSALYWWFRKNGSQVGSYAYTTSNGSWNLMCASEVISLSVGDSVDVYMNTTGGHFDYNTNWSSFSGYFLG